MQLYRPAKYSLNRVNPLFSNTVNSSVRTPMTAKSSAAEFVKLVVHKTTRTIKTVSFFLSEPWIGNSGSISSIDILIF